VDGYLKNNNTMAKFTYNQNAIACVYKGKWLDSLLELRYILSIEETHYWLRDDLSIYYNLDTVPEGIKGGLKTYTPDFLVRNMRTGKATLVELKPAGYDDRWELLRRRKIAEDFIQFMGFDWEYEVVFSHQIVLNRQAQLKFDNFLSKWRIGLSPSFLHKSEWQSLGYIDFVMYGGSPAVIL
jgi:hypothetical protein